MGTTNITSYNKIKEAIDSGNVTFFVQPQCRITNGLITGGEALARIVLPSGETVSPGPWIEQLEADGYITKMDSVVWEKVCRWISRSAAEGPLLPPISINISRSDFRAIDVCTTLNDLTQKYPLEKDSLCLEVTESTYALDFKGMQEEIRSLQQSGFLVYLDDFGSGYSSLNVLDILSVNSIKLDMGFMRKNSCLGRKNLLIIKAILEVADIIGAKVIVEGVETKEQVEALKGVGASYIQGFYFYKPMAPDAFCETLTSQPKQCITSRFHNNKVET